jgi:hypothetical protein
MEKYRPFISYLEENMIFNMPSSDELRSLVNSKLAEIGSSDVKVMFLKEILKLLKSRDIDIYYLGRIMDFKYYAEYQLKEAEFESINSWNEFYNDLYDKYIKGVNSSDFNTVMTYKSLPPGKNKIVWLAKKTEAMYFQKQMGFTIPQLNACFIWINETPFSESDRHGNPKAKFMELIEKHKRK